MSTTAVLTMAEYHRKILTEMANGPHAAQAELARAALARLDDGSYGYCTRCGMKMPEARLHQRPERPHCANCDNG